ncbi:MAG: 4-(cytidine 5'-diphospho)-2-C-methyl-D-erythritol kinase [Candidatus Brocadiia bacterium]
MADEPEQGELTVRAPAKVNLSLDVLGKRPDGFHEIRTVMQAVSLCDVLSFARRGDGRIRLSCSDQDVPVGEDNLVVRAARLLQRRSASRAGADIRLEKRVPVGGGLGGGSSDAAVSLLALNELWRVGLSEGELMELAASLGSDVAFFVRGGTALCEGRGERVSPALKVPTIHHVLAIPDVSVSTGAVYAAATALTTRGPDDNNVLLEALQSGDVRALVSALRNDLQRLALELHECLLEVHEKLNEKGGEVGVSRFLLSGSGSTFFGIARSEDEAALAAEALEAELPVRCTATHNIPAWNGRVDVLTIRRRHL